MTLNAIWVDASYDLLFNCINKSKLKSCYLDKKHNNLAEKMETKCHSLGQ